MVSSSRTSRAAPLNQLRSALTDRYRIGEEIGHGATAFVFRARDVQRDRDVAIKVMRSELASSIGAERFLREVRIASGLTHPHILPVLDSGDVDGALYYIMPLLDGESLRARMKRERQLSIEEALQITRDIANGLQYAHDRGIVHRDVKPENILLAGQTSNAAGGQAYLADFGLARLVVASGESITSSGIAVGTVAYMSPEQSSGTDDVDARTDQYSLACVLFELLAGIPPYSGADARAVLARHRFEPVPRLQHIRETIPRGIDDAIARAMSKVPADRFKTVTAFVQALEAAVTADAVARAASSDGVYHSGSRPLTRIPWPRVLAAVLAAAVLVLVLTFGSKTAAMPDRDPNLIAIAPFEVLNPALGVWREGMLDLLSRSLDGAGPLRTVPTTTILKNWTGKSDRESAGLLARRTGAGLALFGAMAPAGPDSVWISVQILDPAANQVVADVEMTDDLSRIGSWQRNLALAVLKQLAAVRPVGAAPVYSLGSASLPALKAFLQGEQHYRRTAFDSAAFYYERAIAADSAFALAFHRLYGLTIWQQTGPDARARAFALRAGALNRGLPPRDSLLVVAESLWAAYPPTTYASDSAFWGHVRRMLGTLDEATRRYPQDPEAWYSLAIARHSYGHPLGFSSARIQETVDRAIQLDSSFAPAYLSAVQMAERRGDALAARRYARAYLRHGPVGRQSDAIKLTFDLAQANESQQRQLIRAASNELLFTAYNRSAWWTDSTEVAVAIAKELFSRTGRMTSADSSIATFDLAFALAWRGRVDSAYKVSGNQPSRLFGALTILDGVPTDTVQNVFQRLLGTAVWPPTQLPMAITWWADRRDTASLQLVAQRADEATNNAPHGIARAYARRLGESARAHILVIRRDTAAAIDRLRALPDTACPGCFSDRILTARLLIGAGRLADAATLLEQDLANATANNNPLFVLWELERARLADRQGDRAKALRHYGFVEAAWRNADANLQWAVDSARAARRRLAGR